MTETIIVLGLGNILCGDDGFGVHAVQNLQENYNFPGFCRVIDGGTQGQLLYGLVEEADRLLILDAIDFGLAPGSLVSKNNSEIPAWLGVGKLSAHQGSFAEVLALANIKNIVPSEIRLIGLQPSHIEFGKPMSSEGKAALPKAIELALNCLHEWSVYPTPAENRLDSIAREMRSVFLG